MTTFYRPSNTLLHCLLLLLVILIPLQQAHASEQATSEQPSVSENTEDLGQKMTSYFKDIYSWVELVVSYQSMAKSKGQNISYGKESTNPVEPEMANSIQALRLYMGIGDSDVGVGIGVTGELADYQLEYYEYPLQKKKSLAEYYLRALCGI